MQILSEGARRPVNFSPAGGEVVRREDRQLTAAIVLFFTAPLVAEFLLGDIGIRMIGVLLVMAPMYGGGALLIREVVRRAGLGWSRILMLGAAYTLIEEGFTTQSLFNTDYLRMHMHLLDPAWIPALGIGAWWTLFMFNLHTFWSISVSIALVEGLFPSQAEKPWLGRVGDSIVLVLFGIGCVLGTWITLRQDPFVASPVQLTVTGLLALLLAVLALRLPAQAPMKSRGGVPSPWLTGIAALTLGLAVLVIPNHWNWGAFAAMLAVDFIFLAGLVVLNQRAGWTPLHTLSLAAGGAFAYGLHAFIAHPVIGAQPAVLLRAGNALLLLAAALVVMVGARRTARSLRAYAAPVLQTPK